MVVDAQELAAGAVVVALGGALRERNERAAEPGGSLFIDSMPGEGTEVSATLPT